MAPHYVDLVEMGGAAADLGPLGEPVAWYGPIVMNTEEELRIAFDEYRKGTFLKHEHRKSITITIASG